MTKKGILTLVIIGSFVSIGAFILNSNRPSCKERGTCAGSHEEETVVKQLINVEKLHSDILKLIVSSGEKKVIGIDANDAKKALESRVGVEVEADKNTPDIEDLQFDILRLIAKSAVSVCGITPKDASEEIISRYLAIEASDSDGTNIGAIVSSLRSKLEEKAIDEWADNEDAEAIDAFLKQEAEKKPGSIENFVFGLRHLRDKDPKNAKNHLKKFKESADKALLDSVKIEDIDSLIDDIVKK